jgi:two-component system, NarL family, response regulator DevR
MLLAYVAIIALGSITVFRERRERKRPLRVLLVDDSTILRERVASMITELAPDVEVIRLAWGGAVVPAAVRALRPDVVVLDHHVPDGNGMDVVRDIKRNIPAPVVIVFTNDCYPQYRQRCLESGAEFFFDKSNEYGKLRETIEHLNRDGHVRGPRSAAGNGDMAEDQP